MNGKIVLRVLISFLLMIFFITILIFTVPQLRESFFWYANQIKTRIDYAINPPEQVVFVPDASQVQPTLPILPFATMTITSTMVVTAETPQVEITATPEPTPMPQAHKLEGITYFDQHGLWNYCAPANLAMQLSYWGWEGKRTDVGKVLKPFEKDKNVMLYEMVDYVNNNTQYHALARYGGSLDLIKKLVANGFPVLVEKGVYLRDINGKLSWMGHYAVIDGYDDLKEEFITQDSFFKPNLPLNYQDLITQWRSFNYYFMVIYDGNSETLLRETLAEYDDPFNANQIAYQKANDEIATNQGVDLFYAWFNRGTSMVQLQDYAGAATAYDQAFTTYSTLPEKNRPWRMMWYQTGPYFAYYYSGRYGDVINLATMTIDAASEPFLEESFYWRAQANLALGMTQAAVDDLNKSLEYHPGFPPSVELLKQMGYFQ
jgi:tetratricopeptide (TPR) repeat protein